MKKIHENWQSFLLKEDIYSSEMRKFIRFAKKAEKYDPPRRLQLILQYIKSNRNGFSFLGGGAFREAYITTSGEVLKIASKTFQIWDDQPAAPEQNKKEIEIFNSGLTDVFPKVEEYDKDYLWFVVERLYPFVNLVNKDPEKIEQLYPKLKKLITQHSKHQYLKYAWQMNDKMLDLLNYARSTNVKKHEPDDKKVGQNLEWALLHVLGREKVKDKEAVDAFFDYLKDPDPIFKKIRNAVRKFNLSPDDFHMSNLGLDADGNVKIIDVGWESDLKESNVIQEAVYSNHLHAFIQFSYELDNLVKERKISESQKLRRLFEFMNNNNYNILGGGNTRLGFETPSGEVIKIISDYNLQAIRENKKELERFNRSDIEAFPRIEAYDDRDYMWFVVERVTQIGGEQTVATYTRLFPKLFALVESVHKLVRDVGERPIPLRKWDAVFLVRDLLKFKWDQKYADRKYFNPIELDYGTISRIADFKPDTPEKQKIHKYIINNVVEYIQNPDKNFGALMKACIDSNTNPMDFHYDNLGYNDEGEIKIMDAGL